MQEPVVTTETPSVTIVRLRSYVVSCPMSLFAYCASGCQPHDVCSYPFSASLTWKSHTGLARHFRCTLIVDICFPTSSSRLPVRPFSRTQSTGRRRPDVGPTSPTRQCSMSFRPRTAQRLLIGPMSKMTSVRRRLAVTGRQ